MDSGLRSARQPLAQHAAAALPIVLLLVDARLPRVEGALGGVRPVSCQRSPCRSSSTACRHRPLATAVYGAAYGLLPIGWIIVNAVFLYNLTVETGQFEIVKASVANLSADRRIQALLIAFSFGAFIEGASGFGTPVAICSALLMGLGFTPLYAAGLALIANTAPVAFGAIGTPILTLAAVTGLPVSAQRHGGAAAAFRVADHSGMAGGDDERLARAEGRVAGGARVRRRVCDRAVLLEQLRRARARRHRRRAASLGALTLFLPGLEAARGLGVPGGREAEQAARHRRAASQAPVSPFGAGNRASGARPRLDAVGVPHIMVVLWGLPPIKALLNGGPGALAAYRAGSRAASAWPCPDVGRPAAPPYRLSRLPGRADAGRPRADRRSRSIGTRAPRRPATTSTSFPRPAPASCWRRSLTAFYLRVPFGQVLAIAG